MKRSGSRVKGSVSNNPEVGMCPSSSSKGADVLRRLETNPGAGTWHPRPGLFLLLLSQSPQSALMPPYHSRSRLLPERILPVSSPRPLSLLMPPPTKTSFIRRRWGRSQETSVWNPAECAALLCPTLTVEMLGQWLKPWGRNVLIYKAERITAPISQGGWRVLIHTKYVNHSGQHKISSR